MANVDEDHPLGRVPGARGDERCELQPLEEFARQHAAALHDGIAQLARPVALAHPTGSGSVLREDDKTRSDRRGAEGGASSGVFRFEDGVGRLRAGGRHRSRTLVGVSRQGRTGRRERGLAVGLGCAGACGSSLRRSSRCRSRSGQGRGRRREPGPKRRAVESGLHSPGRAGRREPGLRRRTVDGSHKVRVARAGGSWLLA